MKKTIHTPKLLCDTHIALYDIKDKALVEEILKVLTLPYTDFSPIQVVGWSLSYEKTPKVIYTIESATDDDALSNHDILLEAFSNRAMQIILESERNFDVVSKGWSLDSWWLNNLERDPSTLHWGDIHVDVPLESKYTGLIHDMKTKRWNYITTLKNRNGKKRAQHVFTSQFKEWLLPAIIESLTFLPWEIWIKWERLLAFDSINWAPAVPLTVGFNE